MKTIGTLAVLLFLIISAEAALGDCYYQGRRYPTGTNINGVVCQADGTWR